MPFDETDVMPSSDNIPNIPSTSSETLADDESLIASFDELSRLENLIVIGDFNFRDISWRITDPSSGLTTSKTVFTDFVLNSNLHQFITEPTRFRINNLPSILDLVFSNDPHLLTHPIISSPVGNSDHTVITFHIQFNLQYCTPNSNVNKTVYEIFDFENANRQLADIDWNDVFGDIRNPVVFWDKFLHVVNFCKNHNTFKKTIYKNNIKPWINGELIYLIKYKSKLWNKYRRTNRIEDLLIHRDFAKDLKKSVHEARVAYENSIAISNNCKNCTYKCIISSLTTKVAIPLLENDNGDISQSNYENAEVLASTFSVDPLIISCLITSSRVSSSLKNIIITPEKVKHHLQSLKNNSSLGLDLISSLFLKKFSDALAYPRYVIMSLSFTTHILPPL
ncbi:uncharacterized protein [Diabrotica undecimpunctata]|uniref:uncharacterized protein n=1 Tax=Diabrotica undecimpunctata TaxID=50387 RepID=UPI003B63647D